MLIRINENQLNILNEYHAQRRLPFKNEYGGNDYEFSEKNTVENFLDWIEEFGKVGELGASSITFKQGVNSGLEKSLQWFKEKNSQIGQHSLRKFFNERLKDHGFCYFMHDGEYETNCIFNDKGNMYVERVITLEDNLGDVIGDDMFNHLVNSYHNNVGGCWSWKKGNASAYCGDNRGTKIMMRGWIRLEDIDWVETLYINAYRNNGECEIRVKPNASVELFDILGTYDTNDSYYYDDDKGDISAYTEDGENDEVYRFDLGGRHIIVSSTYFGNNGKYGKDGFAEIYDATSDEKRYMDREGNIMNGEGVSVRKLEMLRYKINNLHGKYNNVRYSDLFEYVKEVVGTSLFIIRDSGKMFVLDDMNDDALLGGMFFDSVGFRVRYFEVELNKKVNFMRFDGSFYFDKWYNDVSKLLPNCYFVREGNKWGLYQGEDTKFIFDDVDRLNGLSSEMNYKYAYDYAVVRIRSKVNLIDYKGNLLSQDIWFDKDDYQIIKMDGRDILEAYDEDSNMYIYIDMLTRKIIDRKNVLDA